MSIKKSDIAELIKMTLKDMPPSSVRMFIEACRNYSEQQNTEILTSYLKKHYNIDALSWKWN